jgi:hypothetical protein
MRHTLNAVRAGVLIVLFCSLAGAQSTSLAPSSIVPQLVNFSGKAVDAQGKTISGVAGVTFAIYTEQSGGSPLWLETQSIQADAKGNYTAQLGATKAEGLPLALFTSGEARWLGVTVNGGQEQPRVLLLSVPYALKAADAQTLGGLPASAFMLAAPPVSLAPAVSAASADGGSVSPSTAANVTTTGGSANFLPFFNGASTIIDSVVEQTGSGSAARIGIGTSTPAATLDVKGSTTVRGLLNLPAASTATASAGSNSNGLGLVASTFNSGTKAAANQVFHWFAEPVGNNTSSPSATLNLLFATAPNLPAETGLHISSNGQITFAAGQTFPGTGPGTITGLTAGTALTGGGTSGSVTLNLDTSKVPLLAASNTFTGNQTMNGNVSATGTVAGSSFEIGSNLFGFGSYDNASAYLGFAGNTTSTGLSDTGIGEYALASDTYGATNTAIGSLALYQNTTGYSNTATGVNVLYANTTGTNNTATGFGALQSNTVECCNTAVGTQALVNSNVVNNPSGLPNDAFGYQALYSNTTGFQNAAFGYQALYAAATGSANAAFGFEAMGNAIGYNNAAFGYQALYGGGTKYAPQDSSAFGFQALFSNTSGTNDAFGFRALLNNTGGSENAAFGYVAMQNNTTGGSNAGFGQFALSANTTGSQNTGVGFGALGANVTGSELSCIGAYCSASSDVTNATAIGAHALVEQSNSLVLGGTGDHAVNVGIGTTKPSNILTIGRGLGHPVSDSWETYSSRRWKTNIHPLQDALSKVEQLRGVSYDLKASGKHEIGVIAEEVGAVVPEIVSFEENGKDARGVDYSRLTALLIEAVKAQQKQIAAQAGQVRLLRSQLKRGAVKEAALESRLKQLEQRRSETQVASARQVR